MMMLLLVGFFPFLLQVAVFRLNEAKKRKLSDTKQNKKKE